MAPGSPQVTGSPGEPRCHGGCIPAAATRRGSGTLGPAGSGAGAGSRSQSPGPLRAPAPSRLAASEAELAERARQAHHSACKPREQISKAVAAFPSKR